MRYIDRPVSEYAILSLLDAGIDKPAQICERLFVPHKRFRDTAKRLYSQACIDVTPWGYRRSITLTKVGKRLLDDLNGPI